MWIERLVVQKSKQFAPDKNYILDNIKANKQINGQFSNIPISE